MANTHRRWTGELAKPLRTRVGLLAHLDPADKSVALAHAEIRSKLDLLLDEYAIPRGGSDKWFHLSCALAEEFVPGFRHTQRGRAVKWGMFERGMLVVELERLRKE